VEVKYESDEQKTGRNPQKPSFPKPISRTSLVTTPKSLTFVFSPEKHKQPTNPRGNYRKSSRNKHTSHESYESEWGVVVSPTHTQNQTSNVKVWVLSSPVLFVGKTQNSVSKITILEWREGREEVEEEILQTKPDFRDKRTLPKNQKKCRITVSIGFVWCYTPFSPFTFRFPHQPLKRANI